MKTSLVVTFLTAAFLLSPKVMAAEDGEMSTSVKAQSVNEHPVAIYVNPFYGLLSTVRAGVDFGLSEKFSIGLNAQYMPERSAFRNTSAELSNIKVSRFDIGVDTTVMLIGKLTTRGLYISPAVGYSQIQARDEEFKVNLNTPYIEMNVGYQWVWSKLRLALGGGPVYHVVSQDITVKNVRTGSESTIKENNILALSIDANIGLIF